LFIVLSIYTYTYKSTRAGYCVRKIHNVRHNGNCSNLNFFLPLCLSPPHIHVTAKTLYSRISRSLSFAYTHTLFLSLSLSLSFSPTPPSPLSTSLSHSPSSLSPQDRSYSIRPSLTGAHITNCSVFFFSSQLQCNVCTNTRVGRCFIDGGAAIEKLSHPTTDIIIIIIIIIIEFRGNRWYIGTYLTDDDAPRRPHYSCGHTSRRSAPTVSSLVKTK